MRMGVKAGLAGAALALAFAVHAAPSPPNPLADPQTLLEKTPAFYTDFLRNRMHTEYSDADRYTRFHFGGTCPYEAAITRNIDHLATVLKMDLDSIVVRHAEGSDVILELFGEPTTASNPRRVELSMNVRF